MSTPKLHIFPRRLSGTSGNDNTPEQRNATARNPARGEQSREAAKEYSPRRKPWENSQKMTSPKGAKEIF